MPTATGGVICACPTSQTPCLSPVGFICCPPHTVCLHR
jgi:hypothetical protein